MTTQHELSGWFLGQVAIVLAVTAAILLPVLGVAGLLSGLPVVVVAGTAIVALIVGTIANWRVSVRLGKALREVENVLQAVEKGQYDKEPDGECHLILPDVAASLKRAVSQIRTQYNELTEARNRLRNVINSMEEGVIGVDSEQRILLINQAACKIFNIRDGIVERRRVWEQVRIPQLQNWIEVAIETHKPVGGELHLRATQPATPSRDLALSVSAFSDARLSGAVIVTTDVTELRRLERVRQQFVANASHELKTPITSIQACVETLIDGAMDDLQCRDRFLQTIHEQTARLGTLVKDLMALARLESEPSFREPRPISVEDILQICYERHQQTAERKGLKLSLAPIPPGLRILADEDALEHILDNLLDNALKYTESGGHVTLFSRQDAEFGYLEVKDTGIGISQQHLSRIFERFYRVDRHRSREVGGTGLGLSIVKHLVQSIGGTIQVQSKLHEGSAFSVRFRLAPEGDRVDTEAG